VEPQDSGRFIVFPFLFGVEGDSPGVLFRIGIGTACPGAMTAHPPGGGGATMPGQACPGCGGGWAAIVPRPNPAVTAAVAAAAEVPARCANVAL